MGNILKIIVRGHSEISHPLEGVSDKSQRTGLDE